MSSPAPPSPAAVLQQRPLQNPQQQQQARTRRVQIAVRMRPPRIAGDPVSIVTRADEATGAAVVILNDDTGALSQRGGPTRLEFPVDLVFGGDDPNSPPREHSDDDDDGGDGTRMTRQKGPKYMMRRLFGAVLTREAVCEPDACRETVCVFSAGASGHGKTHAILGRRGALERMKASGAAPTAVAVSATESEVSSSDASSTASASDVGVHAVVDRSKLSSASSASATTATASASSFHLRGKGLVQETVACLFRLGARRLRVSCVEVYCEQVHDLLDRGRVKKVRERPASSSSSQVDNRVYVEHLSHVDIASLRDWQTAMEPVLDKRRTAATERNDRSSRSHAIVWISVLFPATSAQPSESAEAANRSQSSSFRSNGSNGAVNQWEAGRGLEFCFVDLAGSEKPSRTAAFGPSLSKESIAINKSLTALQTALQALVEAQSNIAQQPLASGATVGRSASVGGAASSGAAGVGSTPSQSLTFVSPQQAQSLIAATPRHSSSSSSFSVPPQAVAALRDSTLTWLLQRFLQGCSYTSFVGCVDSGRSQLPEAAQTLRYVGRLRGLHTLYHPPTPAMASTAKRHQARINNDEDEDDEDHRRKQQQQQQQKHYEEAIRSLQEELAQYRSVASGIQEIQRNRIDELIARIAQMEEGQHRSDDHTGEYEGIDAPPPHARNPASLPPPQRKSLSSSSAAAAATRSARPASASQRGAVHLDPAPRNDHDNGIVSSSDEVSINSSRSSVSSSASEQAPITSFTAVTTVAHTDGLEPRPAARAAETFDLARVANFDFSPSRIISSVRGQSSANGNKFTTTSTRHRQQRTGSAESIHGGDPPRAAPLATRRRRAGLASPPEFDAEEDDARNTSSRLDASTGAALGASLLGHTTSALRGSESPAARGSAVSVSAAAPFAVESKRAFPARLGSVSQDNAARLSASPLARVPPSQQQQQQQFRRRLVSDRDPSEYKVSLWVAARVKNDLMIRRVARRPADDSSSPRVAFFPALQALSQLQVVNDAFFDALMPSHAVVGYVVSSSKRQKQSSAPDGQRTTCAAELPRQLLAGDHSAAADSCVGCLAQLAQSVHGFSTQFGLALDANASPLRAVAEKRRVDKDDDHNDGSANRAASPQSSIALGSIVDVAASTMLAALPPLIELHPIQQHGGAAAATSCTLFDPSSASVGAPTTAAFDGTAAAATSFRRAGGAEQTHVFAIVDAEAGKCHPCSASSSTAAAAGSPSVWPCSCAPVLSHDALAPFAVVLAVEKTASPLFALQLRSELDKLRAVIEWARAEVHAAAEAERLETLAREQQAREAQALREMQAHRAVAVVAATASEREERNAKPTRSTSKSRRSSSRNATQERASNFDDREAGAKPSAALLPTTTDEDGSDNNGRRPKRVRSENRAAPPVVAAPLASAVPLQRKSLTEDEELLLRARAIDKRRQELAKRRQQLLQQQETDKKRAQQQEQHPHHADEVAAEMTRQLNNSAAHAPLRKTRYRNYDIDTAQLGLPKKAATATAATAGQSMSSSSSSSSASSSSASSSDGDAYQRENGDNDEPSPLPRRAGRSKSSESGKVAANTAVTTALPQGAVFVRLSRDRHHHRRSDGGGKRSSPAGVGTIVTTASASPAASAPARSAAATTTRAAALLLKPLSRSASAAQQHGAQHRPVPTSRSPSHQQQEHQDHVTASEYSGSDNDDADRAGLVTEFESIKESLKERGKALMQQQQAKKQQAHPNRFPVFHARRQSTPKQNEVSGAPAAAAAAAPQHQRQPSSPARPPSPTTKPITDPAHRRTVSTGSVLAAPPLRPPVHRTLSSTLDSTVLNGTTRSLNASVTAPRKNTAPAAAAAAASADTVNGSGKGARSSPLQLDGSSTKLVGSQTANPLDAQQPQASAAMPVAATPAAGAAAAPPEFTQVKEKTCAIQ